MIDRIADPGWRGLHLAAAGAAGLAAGLAGAWLLPVPLKSAPEALPQTAPAVTPTATQAVPAPASDAAPPSLADILRLASPFQRSLALYRLAAGLDAAGVERLLDQARAFDRLRVRRAVSVLYARYAELDAAAAMRHAQRQGDDAGRWLGVVFRALARNDLDAALAHAGTLDTRQRTSVATAILQVRDDLPQETWAEITADLAPQSGLQDRVARQSVADKPVHAWRQALERKTANDWSDLDRTARRWAETDPLAALEAIRSTDGLDPYLRTSLRSSAVWQWATADPAAALDWTMTLPASGERNDLIGHALHGWAEKDPHAAAAWLHAQGLPATGGGIQQMAKEFAARHPEDAVEWVAALPSHAAGAAIDGVLTALFEADPESAVRLLQRVGDETAQHAAVRGWARADPVAALTWLDRLHDADRRSELAATLLADWAVYDVASAALHIERLTDPGARDETLLIMLQQALAFDADLAEALFERIEDEDARARAARRLYEHLSRTDPARAERYR